VARILGLDITLRKAPSKVPEITGSNFAALSVRATVASASVPANEANSSFIQATGELPVTLPKRRADAQGLSTRNVSASPLDDWFMAIPSKVPPKQVDSILRGAAAGNLWNQYQLSRRMEESWPVYKKCVLELKTAVASAKYVVHPHCEPGQEPTPSAIEKADVVRRAIQGFQPDRFADEDGFNGMVFDLCEAVMNGISIVELIWNERAIDPNGGPESVVKSSSWVNPRNISFKSDGSLGVARASESGNMSFSNQVRDDLMSDPDKFLVAKIKSKSGSPLTAGLMRTLAQMWVMVVYGRDYALNFAQKYGNPFFDITFDTKVTGNNDKNDFERLAKDAVNQGWCVHPLGTELKLGAAHTMGSENAHMTLMKFADEQCQLLLLGQTLTTSVGASGSRALGSVHENVRQEIIEHYAQWIAGILTDQFADSVCRVNFGTSYTKNPERPTIVADFSRPLSVMETAEYLQKLSNVSVPLVADEIYKLANVQQPAAGDKSLNHGNLIIAEEPMTETEKRQKDFDTQMAQQESVNEMTSNAQVQGAITSASYDDRWQLESLVSAAEKATHLNGEATAVKNKVAELLTNKTR